MLPIVVPDRSNIGLRVILRCSRTPGCQSSADMADPLAILRQRRRSEPNTHAATAASPMLSLSATVNT
jgi:hypothetical protein